MEYQLRSGHKDNSILPEWEQFISFYLISQPERLGQEYGRSADEDPKQEIYTRI